MEYSNKLFKLIRSLTPTEKRHFRLSVMTSKEGDAPVFLQLYDLIEKAIQRNAEVQHFRINEKEFSSIKNISFNKRYLYESILRSLRAFHFESDDLMSTHLLLLNMIVLKRKGLREEAHELLQKGKKMAYKYELSLLALHFIRHEIELIGLLNKDVDKTFEQIEKCIAEADRIISSIRENTFIVGKRLQTYLLDNFDSQFMPANYQKKLTTIVHEKRLKIKEDLFSSATKMAHNHIQASYMEFVKREYFSSSKFYGNTLELLSADPMLRKNSILDIYPDIYNYCKICLKAGRYNEVEKYISVLEKDPFKFIAKKKLTSYTDCIIRSFIGILKLQLLILKNSYTPANDIDTEIKKIIVKSGSTIDPDIYLELLYYTTIYMFAAGQTMRSLFYLKKITEAPRTTTKKDIRVFAIAFRLIIYYESQSIDKMDHAFKQLREYLDHQSTKLKEEYIKLGKLICNELPFINSQKEISIKLTTLLTEIKLAEKKTGIQLDPYLKAWLESKIDKKTFAKKIMSVSDL